MFLSPLRLALLLGALVGSVLVTVGAGRAAAPIEASGSRVISSAPLTTGADDTGVGSTGTGGTAAGGTAAFAQVGDAPDPVHPLYHSSITAAAAASPAQRPTSELAAQIEALGPAGIGADSLALPDERAVPVRLRVPALAIDAEIIPVGVTAVGDYEVPPASQVGWYRFGSVPGEAGSAVLAAHIAWDGVDGVFRHLADLPAGSEIEVDFDDGSTVRATTGETSRVDKDELSPSLFDRDGEPRIVLITCGGAFNRTLRSYEDNVIATAR